MIDSTHDQHREQAVAARSTPAKTYSAKSRSASRDDCVAVAEAHARSGRQFVVGFVLRYAPLYRRIERLVRDGGIGNLVSLEFNETLEFNHGGFILSG